MAESEGLIWSSAASISVTDTWESLNPKREPKNELDKDAFLQLMMTQMKYQDPLSPMDNQQFMSQMAQFTSLEQMVNLTSAYSKTQAYSMMGKGVQGVYTNPDTDERIPVEGMVTAVSTKGSEVYLTLDDNIEVPLDSVTNVMDDYLTDVMVDAVRKDTSYTRAQNLVGKRIQGVTYDEDGKLSEYVEGVVDYVRFNSETGIAELVIGNKVVYSDNVMAVSDGADNPFLIGKTITTRTTSEDGSSTTDKSVSITGVVFKDEKPYLQIVDGDGKTSEISVDNLNYVSEATNYVGKHVEHDSYIGTVAGVVVTGGTVYLQVKPDDGGDIKELSYKSFIGADKEEEEEKEE